MASLTEQVDSILRQYPFGRASAAKRGRNPNWPWVPIIDYGKQKVSVHATRTAQIRNRAYRTREEACACARQCIDEATAHLRSHLLDPRYRALREQYGLPRELVEEAANV
ncbi:MAG: hypothetical protein GEU91_18385 [Rhizobiales bacterium]|nr:hypothetical protein [Hyphomicrobiales bacterium]